MSALQISDVMAGLEEAYVPVVQKETIFTPLALQNIGRHHAFLLMVFSGFGGSQPALNCCAFPFFFFPLPYGQLVNGNMTPLCYGQPQTPCDGLVVNVFARLIFFTLLQDGTNL